MAQDISTTNLAANWAATSAKVAVGVLCDWNRDGELGRHIQERKRSRHQRELQHGPV